MVPSPQQTKVILVMVFFLCGVGVSSKDAANGEIARDSGVGGGLGYCSGIAEG